MFELPCPHGGSAIPVLKNLVPLSGLNGYQAHTWCFKKTNLVYKAIQISILGHFALICGEVYLDTC